MKKLLFLFSFIIACLSLDAQVVWRPSVLSPDTLTNADSTIFYFPELGSSFPAGCVIDVNVYTKAVSGTTTALVAYWEYSNYAQTVTRTATNAATSANVYWARDYTTLDTLQIHASTWTQPTAPVTAYARYARLVVKQTGTAVRIVGIAASIRKNPVATGQ